MKKALFFIVALASVAIGCTKSEVVKAPGHNKEINTLSVGPASRTVRNQSPRYDVTMVIDAEVIRENIPQES